MNNDYNQKLTEAEKSLFQQAMKNVVPLKQGINNHQQSLQHSDKHRKIIFPDHAPTLFSSDNIDYIDPEASITFHRGNDSNILKKLKKNGLVEAELDLHGYTLSFAAQNISQSIASWHMQGIRIARVIHGKGNNQQPSVIKAHIPCWLQSISCVLAYTSCQQNQGGNGAVLVQLKRRS